MRDTRLMAELRDMGQRQAPYIMGRPPVRMSRAFRQWAARRGLYSGYNTAAIWAAWAAWQARGRRRRTNV